MEALTADVQSLPTADLIAKHNEAQGYANEGSPATLGADALLAIRAELRGRRIPLCTCGAPQTGGVHANTCQEGR